MKKTALSKQLYALFIFGGALGILFGLLHLSDFSQTGNPIKLYDSLINSLFGVISFVQAKLLQSKKIGVVHITILSLAISLVYAALVGRDFNWITLLFSCYWLFKLWELKKLGFFEEKKTTS